jgi:osmotically-inducible protein OsmY
VSPRGPKGWVRPDGRILDELCERIMRAGVDASALEVAVDAGEVSLRGELGTREERHCVMDLAERVLGVVAIDAEIRVREAAGPEEEAEEPGPPTWH